MKHGSLISPDDASFGFGASSNALGETHAASADGADFVAVPDAHLLFSGDFTRAGSDLKIVGDDGKSFLITDYFKKDKHPTLHSPDGATLSGDLVGLLAGPLAPGQYAQAGAPQPGAAEVVGRVATVSGNCTVIRNGVAVTVNAGDAIQKNDVMQTGAGAAMGVAFNDGTTFNLSANARLAVSEFIYDPQGSNNASAITLIQGAATFVAGQIAKTGDMKVGTPIATMGIRGTAVMLDINAADGRVSISVIDQRDNQQHNVEVFDRNGNLIATATSIGGKLYLTPTQTLDVIASFTNKTPDLVAQEFAAFQNVLSSYDAAKQFFPNLPDHTDLNTGPKPAQYAGSPGSGTPPPPATTGLGDPVPGKEIKITQVTITTPSDTTGQGPGHSPSDLPNGPQDPTPQTHTFNVIDGTDHADFIQGTAGDDIVHAFGGDDTIEAGDGKGNDTYDGGADFDKLIYPSATTGIVFDLKGIAAQNTADDAPGAHHIDHDTFTNIERIESGSGDDVFILHNADNWQIDAGAGFDTVKLVAGLDLAGDNGPEITNVEMVDLTNGGENTVRIEAGFVESNPNHELRIIGDAKTDTVNLAPGGLAGHWVKSGTPDTAEDLFPSDIHGDAGVTYQKYEFVDLFGCVKATTYIDIDVKVGFEPQIDLPPQTYLAFDGNDYAASAPASYQTDNVTMEGWVRWDGTDTDHGQMLFYNGNSSHSGYGIVGDVVGNTLHLSGLTGGHDIMSSDAFLSANEWHHVSLVRDAGEFHLYVDGVEYDLDFAGSGVGTIGSGNHTFIGGNPDNPNEYFHGDIAEVRLWDVARTQEQIDEARFGPLNGDEPDLAGYWPLSQNSGAFADDQTDHNHDLTFHGTPTWASGLQFDEDQTVKITGIRVTDSDAGDSEMHVTLGVAHGALELVDESGVCVHTNDDGTITISGTLTDVNAALDKGVLFIPEANYNGPDGLTVTVTDADGLSHTRDALVEITPVNEAPVLDLDANNSSGATGADYQTTIAFGVATAVLDSDATITEASTLDSATIQLTGEGNGGYTDYVHDQLFIDVSQLSGAIGNGASGSWHGISWQYMGGASSLQVQITGSGSTDDYLQILHAARMQFDSDTGNTAANVSVSVHSDGGDSNVATTAVDIPNRAPDIEVLTALDNRATATVTETDEPPSPSGTLTISDIDQDLLTVTVTGVTAEGTLGAHQATDFDGFLSISQSDGTQYTWHFAPDNETFDYLGEGQSLILHYSIHASDGAAADGEIITITINGTNDAPVVDAHAAEASYTIQTAPVVIDDQITLTDIDSTTLHGATVKVDNVQDGDTLNFTSLHGITGDYNAETGVLVLTGDASVADYQDALRSISYQNDYSYASTADRTISYQVDDGATSSNLSNVATSTVHVGGGETPNEAPVIHTDAAYTDEGGDEPGDSTILAGLTVTDADGEPGDQYTVVASAEYGTLSVSEGNPQSQIEFHDSLQSINNKLAHGVTYTNPLDFTDNLTDVVTLTVTDPNGASDTVNFRFKVFGDDGVNLTGNGHKDVLFGTGNDDTFTGGGGADTFVFAGEHGIGHDTVTDFVAGVDKIDLGAGFASVPLNGDGTVNMTAWRSEVINGPHAIEQVGNDTVIHLDNLSDQITLKNVNSASLTANDFIIHPGSA